MYSRDQWESTIRVGLPAISGVQQAPEIPHRVHGTTTTRALLANIKCIASYIFRSGGWD